MTRRFCDACGKELFEMFDISCHITFKYEGELKESNGTSYYTVGKERHFLLCKNCSITLETLLGSEAKCPIIFGVK